MPSGQELLEETTTYCETIVAELTEGKTSSEEWISSLTEIIEKFEKVSGTFFFKTIPSLPPTKACHSKTSALLGLLNSKQWDEFGPALSEMIKSAQTLIEKAGMKGTILT